MDFARAAREGHSVSRKAKEISMTRRAYGSYERPQNRRGSCDPLRQRTDCGAGWGYASGLAGIDYEGKG
jgi:hypothetical protein